MRTGPGDALLHGDGCTIYEHCLTCTLGECVYENSREYRTRRKGGMMAVDEAGLKKLRGDKPPCKVPGCTEESTVYAWNDAERVLDHFCRDHRDYAQDRYYHEWNWL